MAIAFAIVISVAVLLYVFSRLTRARSGAAPPQENEPRRSRRQRKLDKLREMDPLPEPRSMFDIMMEEAADLGVNEIPGGEGLEVPVKLKVCRRDASVREGCEGEVRYAVADGIDPAHATVDEVRLVCVETAPVETAQIETPSEADAAADTPADQPDEPPQTPPDPDEPAPENGLHLPDDERHATG